MKAKLKIENGKNFLANLNSLIEKFSSLPYLNPIQGMLNLNARFGF